MDYPETLAWIHGTERFGSRLGLDRMRRLLHRLGDPQEKVPFLHVAGTNVKGSTTSMIASALTIDFVMLGRQSSVQILVFSEKYQEIADYIINELDRGVTTLKATGWFTKTDKEVLLLITRKSEMHDVTAVVKHIDPKALVSVTPASGVYGEGFEEIKTGLKRKKLKNKLS